MLRIVLSGLLAVAVACATAQAQPKPSPPAPGSDAYTEKALRELNDASFKYDKVAIDPNASLEALDKAYGEAYQAYWNAESALQKEAEAHPDADMKAAREARDVASSEYKRLSGEGKDYEREKQAEKALMKAIKAYQDARARRVAALAKGKYAGRFAEPQETRRHMALLAAAKKAQAEKEAEEKKKAEEKKAQNSQGSSAKTDCAPQVGLAGAMENLACKENHAGAGH